MHTFPMRMFTLLSVDEILLPSCMKWLTNFRDSFLFKTQIRKYLLEFDLQSWICKLAILLKNYFGCLWVKTIKHICTIGKKRWSVRGVVVNVLNCYGQLATQDCQHLMLVWLLSSSALTHLTHPCCFADHVLWNYSVSSVGSVCYSHDHTLTFSTLCFWSQKERKSSLNEVTEVLDRETAGGFIKNKFTQVLNVSTSLFISFLYTVV